MTPEYVKNEIHEEYLRLVRRARRREIEEQQVYRICESLARLSAERMQTPEQWRQYMPVELR